jgi:predicted amidohydrolase
MVQCELAWEAPADNRQHLETLMPDGAEHSDLIVLPEMFTTGFSMNALANAEEPGGATEQWLQAQARQRDCAITGSIAVRVGEAVYNRMLFATPEGVSHYDKRHLFRMAGEHQRYAPGRERVIVPWRGWRIHLQVCYDLRFPVFSRNREDYDLMLFVANWPSARRMHWRALLPARAIENLACVVGVNRIGEDARGLDYTGDSRALNAEGRVIADLENKNGTVSAVLSGADLVAYRERFPCHLDADDFQLH